LQFRDRAVGSAFESAAAAARPSNPGDLDMPIRTPHPRPWSKPFFPFLLAALCATFVIAVSASPAPPPAGAPAGGADGSGRMGRGLSPRQGADLVLRGGPIYTMDRARSWAEAVAIKGEKIVYVGSSAGAADFIGPRTKVVDLGGRMVLPGFQDSHLHPVGAGVAYLGCPLYDLETKEAYVKAVKECAAKHSDKPWIRGDGWTLDAFAPTGIPRKDLLDAVIPDRPVYLESSDGHSGWVNSKALALAGITKQTPDPPGGRIDRDAKTGEPVGGLQDEAMELVKDRMPYSEEDRLNGLRHALKVLNGFGVTAFQDAIVELTGADSFRSADAYRTLDDGKQLTARAVLALWWDRNKGEEQIEALRGARHRYTKGRVRATTVKIMQDGVMEVQTAAVLKPYKGKPGVTGLVMVDPEKLKGYVTRLDKEGFQVHFHAIGDAAIRQCLDAVEAALRANGARDARHHISHIQLFHPSDIPRFRQLNVIANFQPLWAWADPYVTELTLPFFEPERARWMYPIKSLLDSGAVVAFGSDWSVSSANPLEEIEVAVTRMGWDGQSTEPWIPEERISLRDALAAFTINAAYLNFHDDTTGSIEAGKLADLIVLDRNLFGIPPAQISEAKVVLTLLGGQPVHGDLKLGG
jgi:hypothetical protein